MKNLEISFLLDFYGELLTEKQFEAVKRYYDEDLSLAEIANEQCISRQGVRDSIKRAESLMLSMEEKLGLAQKFQLISDNMDVISSNADRIGELNNKALISTEINNCVEEIQKSVRKIQEM